MEEIEETCKGMENLKLEDSKMKSETEMADRTILDEKGEGKGEEKYEVTDEPDYWTSDSDTTVEILDSSLIPTMDPITAKLCMAVVYNDVIMQKVFSKLDLQDLLSSRQVCLSWNKYTVPYVRTNQVSSLLLTDDRITQFMEVMDNCYYFPCSKFCFDFYCVTTEKLLQFCSKYGSYARDYEIMCCVRYQANRGDEYEQIQKRKAPSVNHKVAILLAHTPDLNALKIRTRFEVSFKPEEIQNLPKVYSNLEFLKTDCTFPMVKTNQTDMVSILVSRAPKLKKFGLHFSSHDTLTRSGSNSNEVAQKSHDLNTRLPEILRKLLAKPKLSIRTMFTGKDFEIVEQLANIPMNLSKMIVQHHLRGTENTSRQETFLRWFVTWLIRCEEHLKVLGLATDGSEFVRLPPLKNLAHFNMFFNVIRYRPDIEVTPLISNQFPNLFSLALFTFDPRHWETADGNLCVMNSVKCLEVACNAAPTALPAIWRIMFPNMDSLTLRSPSLIQLSMVIGELTHLRNLRIYDMAGMDGRHADLFGIDLRETEDWVWNLFTDRPTRIPDSELLTFDPTQESMPDLENSSLACFTALETLAFSDCCKDAVRAVIYMSRIGGLRKLEHLCIIGEENDVSPEALEILRGIHTRVCFHLSGDASEHEQNEYSISW